MIFEKFKNIDEQNLKLLGSKTRKKKDVNIILTFHINHRFQNIFESYILQGVVNFEHILWVIYHIFFISISLLK